MRLVVAVVLALVACSSKSSSPPAVVAKDAAAVAAAPPKQVAEQPGKTDVRFDRRIELLSIISRLSGAKEYLQAKPSPYLTALDAHFELVAKHEAVEHATKLRNSYAIAYDAPMLLAIHLDDKLEPREGAGEAMAAIDYRWKGVDVVAYAAKLRDFVAKSKFDEFMAKHAEHHGKVAEALRAIVDAENPVGWFDATFGKQAKARYIVVPSLIAGPANFGPSTTLPDGTVEMYQVIGLDAPSDTDDGMPKAEAPTIELLVHEMAHSYINPVFGKHRAALQPAGQQLFALVALPMRRQSYPRWEIMMNESGVRAVTALYMKDRKGDVAGATTARAEVRRGFVWTNELVELFRKYQRDRGTYPDLEAYMPKVIEFFNSLVKQYAGKLPKTPFMGPFDALFNGDPLVVAGPVTEWETLTTYVKQVHAQILATRGPLEPASADFFTKHPNKHIVAYGTPTSNAVVAQIAERASWKITTEGITLGKKHFAGPTLVLVAVWYRHDDPTKGVGVYAASSNKLLPGINSLRHGDHDWMIAKPDGKGNHAIIASGDWPQFNGAWVAPGE